MKRKNGSEVGVEGPKYEETTTTELFGGFGWSFNYATLSKRKALKSFSTTRINNIIYSFDIYYLYNSYTTILMCQIYIYTFKKKIKK